MREIILLIAVLVLTAISLAEARVKVKGRGDKMNFDPASIPANFQPSVELMTRKCSKCHTMERTVIAIQTGVAPITGQSFDKQAVKAYGIKMLRKPDSGMSKQEIHEVVLLLNYLLEENAK